MQRSPQLTAVRRRSILIALLAAWPAVVVAGLLLNRVFHSHAPSALLPIAWLLALATWIQCVMPLKNDEMTKSE